MRRWLGLGTRFFSILVLVLLMALGGVPREAGAQGVPQRKSVTALTPTEVASLRRGVARMMARNTAGRSTRDFRRSWIYWANVHSHFGSDCRGAITGAGMAGVQLFVASGAREEATWCQCEHGTDQFLPWHRMVLYYFERVLQQAAGDNSLRLPYWDYATDPELPAAFRDPTYVDDTGVTVPNPLFVPARRTGLNGGTAGIASTVSTASGAMGATSYGTFRTRLERTPHGAVHCAIGVQGCPSGLMGSVPSSALDPIFWLHHANIDRLYECWLKVDEPTRLPSAPAILDQHYSYIDRDGSTQDRRVGDMLRTSQLNYAYTAGADCPAPAAAPSMVMAQMQPTLLDRGITSVPVETEAPPAAAAALQAQRQRAEPPAPVGATVVIEGLAFDAVPGVLYNVYLEGRDGERVPVGVIDFFGFDAGFDAAAGDGQAAGGAHGEAHLAGRERLEFDATEAVAKLGLKPGDKPSLVFEPTTGLTSSEPERAAAQISPQARVRFDHARLRFD